jgi:hypothetical protein
MRNFLRVASRGLSFVGFFWVWFYKQLLDSLFCCALMFFRIQWTVDTVGTFLLEYSIVSEKLKWIVLFAEKKWCHSPRPAFERQCRSTLANADRPRQVSEKDDTALQFCSLINNLTSIPFLKESRPKSEFVIGQQDYP